MRPDPQVWFLHLKFLPFFAASWQWNFESKTHTRFMILLVSLGFRSSYVQVPRGFTNFRMGR